MLWNFFFFLFFKVIKKNIKKYNMGFLLFLMGYGYFFDKWEVCLVKNYNLLDEKLCSIKNY